MEKVLQHERGDVEINTFLLALIAFKVVCLFFCWKAASMARKERQKKSQEWDIAQNKMSQLMEQNQKLSETLEEMKGSQQN